MHTFPHTGTPQSFGQLGAIYGKNKRKQNTDLQLQTANEAEKSEVLYFLLEHDQTVISMDSYGHRNVSKDL